MRRCYFAVLAGGAGFLACVVAFVCGFFPPGDWAAWSTAERIQYYAIMVVGFLVLASPPFVLRAVKREGWPRMEPLAALEAEA